MGSSFSLVKVDAEVDVSRLADRLLNDPRVQSVLTQHAELARSLTEIHGDLAKSLSQDSQKLVRTFAQLSRALESDSRTLTNELTALCGVLGRESEALGQSYTELGWALTFATYAVGGAIVVCGLAYSYKAWKEANQIAAVETSAPAANATEKVREGESSTTDPGQEEMVELRITGSGGKEYVIAVPLKAVNMFSRKTEA